MPFLYLQQLIITSGLFDLTTYQKFVAILAGDERNGGIHDHYSDSVCDRELSWPLRLRPLPGDASAYCQVRRP